VAELHLDRHAGNGLGTQLSPPDRPPVIEEYFHGSPQGDPADDEQALGQHFETGRIGEVVSQGQASEQKSEADDETRQPALQQATKFDLREVSLVFEIVGDGFGQGLRVLRGLPGGQVDEQLRRLVCTNLTDRLVDIGFGGRIEVLLAKRSRVERVK